MINQTELQQFLQDPAQHFETPDTVVDSEKLDSAQKLQILESWEGDEKNLQTAAAENMGGGESDILDKVIKAIIRLKELVK
ncbi:MAG: hypothetical protein ACI9A2_001539 [Halioglobus sp.]|jgi:hypothetical protein